MASKKFPNIYQFVDKDYRRIFPMYQEMEEPSKPSKEFAVAGGVFEVLFILNLVVDLIRGKEWPFITVDIVLVVVYTVILAMYISLWNRYKRIHKLWKDLDTLNKCSASNPTVKIAELLAYYSRGKYIKARNTADRVWMSVKESSSEEYFESLTKNMDEEADKLDKVLTVVAKDPKILRSILKLDVAEEKVRNEMFARYEELANLSDEELAKVEKKYDKLENMRKLTREWNKKKEKK